MEETQLLYVRLADEVADLIAADKLRPGERLPSIRNLARDRGLSISTVVQALRRLEDRGLIEARPQSGYFVCPPALVRPEPRLRPPPPTASSVDVSERLVRLLQLSLQPGMVPLAAALPAPTLLPLNALRRHYATVVRRQPRLLDGAGHVSMSAPHLVRQLVRRSLPWGGRLAAEELIVTNSCTEALGLCLRAVTRAGDTVAVESPGYYLMLQLLESLGLKALEIPTDPGQGISVEALDLATRAGGVAACLLVPNASNPLGSAMPEEAKRRLAMLAAERGVAIIEDDVYGDLHFGDRRPWPIKAFDTSGNVLYCASFSKSLSPALRLGYVAAGRYRERITLLKTLSSGATNPVTQAVLAEYLGNGGYDRHLRTLRRHYEAQVAAMQAAVARYFPATTRIAQPQGGFVLWVELPEAIDTGRLFDRAVAEGIAFIPGDLFSPSGMYRNCLRLSCGNPHTPEIDAAVRRLGQLVDELE